MRQERGVALLIALILAVLLSLIGLSLTFSTMTTVRLGTEFENHERAVLVADGGLSEIRADLRADAVNGILSSTTQVPAFAAYVAPADGSYQFVAKLVPTQQPGGSVTYAFGTTDFDIRGTAQMYNHSGNILMAISRLPLRVAGWREVTPEIEGPER